MIVIVDFDGTLALGLTEVIKERTPNLPLIQRLQKMKIETNPIIKVVTARGARGGLSNEEKIERYKEDIEGWLKKYNVPFDALSFNKEYGSLYIDDLSIRQHEDFNSIETEFVKNKLIFTKDMVIKHTPSSENEAVWYGYAKKRFLTPEIYSYNPDMIVMEKISNHRKPTANEIIEILECFEVLEIPNYPFETYRKRVSSQNIGSDKAKKIISNLPEHKGTFFHGDLSTTNVLVGQYEGIFLIDPNYKGVFGSYLTDAGKAYFSFIAYERDYHEAKKISDKYGSDVIKFAVAEGMRVCRNRKEYISIVNNIADLL